MANTTLNVKIAPMESPTFRRFTADEAMRMVEVGILGEDEPVELLDGVLVEMSPKGPEHVAATIGQVEFVPHG